MNNALPGSVGTSNAVRGISWMVLFTLGTAVLHASIRHVSQDLHPFEIAFFRCLFGLLVIVPWLVRFGMEPLKTARGGLLAARGFFNTLSMLVYFWALSVTPLANATTLAFTAPIFATLLALLLYRESIGVRRAIAIAAGFFGVLVVLRPTAGTVSTGELAVLFSAFTFGACIIMIKSLGRTESSVTIVAYMSLFMTPMTFIPALMVWSWPSAEQWAWLVFMGVIGSASQMALAEALRAAETPVVMPVDFVKLIWVAIIGYFAFGEVPDVFVWAGGILIFSATAYITYREHMLGMAKRSREGAP